MKRLLVTIKQEMEVPDEWNLEKTDDGTVVINMGNGEYLDMTIEPLVTQDKNGAWTDGYDDEFANSILDMCQLEDISYELLDQ